MSKTWQTEEMAVNRKKNVEHTHTSSMSLTKHITRRGTPTRPPMRSESANEVRNILVSVLRDFFLWIKKITRPLIATMIKEMSEKSTINGEERIVSLSSVSVSLLWISSTQLLLQVKRWDMLIRIWIFARSESSFLVLLRELFTCGERKMNSTISMVLHEPISPLKSNS